MVHAKPQKTVLWQGNLGVPTSGGGPKANRIRLPPPVHPTMQAHTRCPGAATAAPDVAIVGEAERREAAQVLQVLDGGVGEPGALYERQAGQPGRRLHQLALQQTSSSAIGDGWAALFDLSMGCVCSHVP